MLTRVANAKSYKNRPALLGVPVYWPSKPLLNIKRTCLQIVFPSQYPISRPIYKQLHIHTIPDADWQLALSSCILRKPCRFITMPCALIILEYAQVNSCGGHIFLYILYSKLEHLFSVSLSPKLRTHNYKTKSNRTVIVISRIPYDEMSNNILIIIHCSERNESPL